MQLFNRPVPFPLENQIVPVRNQVPQRASQLPVTGRDATIHAPGALFHQVLFSHLHCNFIEIFYPDFNGLVLLFSPFDFHESGRITHVAPPGILVRKQQLHLS